MKVYAVWSIDFYSGIDDTDDELLKVFKSKEKAINYIVQQIEEDEYFKGATFPNNIKELIEKHNGIYFSSEYKLFVEELHDWENGVEFYIEEWEAE